MDPWAAELFVSGLAEDARSLVRDADRGLVVRVHRGVLIEAGAWAVADAEARHVLRMRALALVAPVPPVFSHWSAAVLHGLPAASSRLRRVHTTVPSAGARGAVDVAGHVYALARDEVEDRRGLLVTSIGRTVVDVAGSGSAEEGVVVADAALAAGVPRPVLLAAVDLAGPRKSARRISTVVDFADEGGRSAAESSSRWSMHRLGVEPPVLQHPVFDAKGHVGDADFWFPEARAVGEVDGLVKYLDPRYAPQGAGRKVYDEKVREDRMRTCVDRMARWSWAEGRDPRLLGPILARVGVTSRRTVLL